MNLDINNYPGSKGGNGVYQWIINHIPEYSIFQELFGGSAVITHKLIEQENKEGKVFGYCRYFVYEKSRQVFDQLETKSDTLSDPMNFNKCGMAALRSLVQFPPNQVFVYLDPPYLKDYRRDSKADLYHIEWNEADHIQMLDLASKAKFNCMISGYDNPLYNEVLAGWRTSTFETMTRGGTATEKIWMNYDISELPLACTAFVGKDYKDRQRVSRRKRAYAKKFQKMPLHERQAILEHIQNSL